MPVARDLPDPAPGSWVGTLTDRELSFLKYFSEVDFDPAQRMYCAIKAGYPGGQQGNLQAGRVFSRAIRNLQMQRELELQNITFKSMATKLKELLEAKHPMAPEQPDNFIQHKALETALRLHDVNPPTKVDIESKKEINIVISDEIMDRAKKALGTEIIEDAIEVEPEKLEAHK